MEVWIQPNRRPMGLALIPNALMLFLAAFLLAIQSHWILIAVAVVLVVFGVVGSLGILFLLRLPRLAYENGELLVYLRRAGPIRIPIDVVECFFLGQAGSRLPAPAGSPEDESETTTIVVRLAEAAEEWGHREVIPALGNWCDGYITIRGTWCEPINGALIKGLNEKLIQVHRKQKQAIGKTK